MTASREMTHARNDYVSAFATGKGYGLLLLTSHLGNPGLTPDARAFIAEVIAGVEANVDPEIRLPIIRGQWRARDRIHAGLTREYSLGGVAGLRHAMVDVQEVVQRAQMEIERNAMPPARIVLHTALLDVRQVLASRGAGMPFGVIQGSLLELDRRRDGILAGLLGGDTPAGFVAGGALADRIEGMGAGSALALIVRTDRMAGRSYLACAIDSAADQGGATQPN